MLLRPVLMPILRNPLQGIADGIRNMLAELLGSSQFFVPLTHSLVLSRGTGSPTYTNTTANRTFRDWEGVLRYVPSGCARFEGARYVRNLLTFTEDLTNAAWIVDGGVTKTNATTVTFTAVADRDLQQIITTDSTVVGRKFVFSVTLALQSGTPSLDSDIKLRAEGTSISGEQTQNIGLSISSTPTRFSFVITTTTAGTTVITGIQSDIACAITFTEAQLEDVTGQADQTASEYVSVGVLSAPYHGAGVDGVEFFNTGRDGALLSPQPAYLVEVARTQILATADIRDMTTAAWTLGATMTRARTSVGADGAANSATRLTGGAVAATNTCYTTIVAAASSRTYSALVKRVTGTGPVRIVQTGTETDISTQLNTTGYALVQLNASILNAVMGFKIDTNGDAIDVDFNQFEAGAFASSRIAAAGTRAADVDANPTASNILAAASTVYLEFTPDHTPSGTIALWGTYVDASNYTAILHDATNMIMRKRIAGVNYDATIANAFTANTTYKVCGSWGASGVTVTVNGTEGTPDANTTAAQIAATMQWGADGNSLQQPFATERNARVWQRQLSTSERGAITA